MVSICITGSYAAGKTFILNYLKEIGYKVCSADNIVKELYLKPEVQHQILNILPDLKIFNIGNIATLIYNNIDLRKKLELYIHPLVKNEVREFIANHQIEKLIFIEIPLAFETNFADEFDFIIVCYCSEKCRLERAKTKSNFNYDIFKKIEKIQLPQEIKIKKADFAINTEKEAKTLKLEINKLINKILS